MMIARGTLLVLLAAALGAALWAAGAMLLHLDEPVYRLGPVRVAVVLAAALAVVLGAWLVARSASAGVGLLALFTALSTVFSFVAMFSLGFLALPFVALFGLLFAWRARRAPGHAGRVLGGAFLVALGLGVILVAQPFSAIVRCLPNGVVQTSSRPFDSDIDSEGSGSASIGPGGEADGMVEAGGVRYAYNCRNDELVQFERID